MRQLVIILIAWLLSGCTFGFNAIRPHNHESRAAVRQDAARLRELGPQNYKMADKLVHDWDAKVSAPMWCMFGDMGLLIGGAGALSLAQSLERDAVITTSWVEPINIAGLATSAIVFVSLGVSLIRYGHL